MHDDKIWMVYDSRALAMGTDEACVLSACGSLGEARQDVKTMFPMGVIFEYDVEETDDVPRLVNERHVP